MNVPKNIDAQLEAARTLLALCQAETPAPSTADPEEVAINAFLNAQKRLLAAGVLAMPDANQRAVALAHILGFMGEFVGQGLAGLPCAAREATLTLFAEELSTATNNRAQLVKISGAPATEQSKESLH